MTGITFDAGGLIALDRNDRRVLALIKRLGEHRIPITVPATALAQAVRRPARQVRLTSFVHDPGTCLAALDESDATEVGILLAQTATSDIADAHVVICARRAGGTVVTSDPKDLRRLDADLKLIVV